MTDNKVFPGPITGTPPAVKEAVCIDTGRVYDSCRDKECLEDLRVYLTCDSQCVLDHANCVKCRNAEVIWVDIDVEPVPFNKGFYTVDLHYYYRITAEAYTQESRPILIEGVATYEKRLMLFGGEGHAHIFTSQMISDNDGIPLPAKTNRPSARVEVVDPIVLDIRFIDPCDPCACNCCCDDSASMFCFPKCICNCFNGGDFVMCGNIRKLFVTLGQFTITKLIRASQLLIPSYDFCLPEKECNATTEGHDPCEMFKNIQFPVEEFFPVPQPGEEEPPCRNYHYYR